MTASDTAHTTSEVTGIRSAIARCGQIAATHEKASSNEGFLGSLNDMEVGTTDQQTVRDAMEASKNAGLAWTRAATILAQHNLPLAEQYALNPNAANKHANTNE